MDENENGSFHMTPKRKRDHPKKDQSLALEAYSQKEQFGSSAPCHVELRPCSQHADVGEQIGGVIEAVFDAGYLLNVKLSSGTTLRGVVFKPGHYVPFSDENDVAPNVQLVKRNDVPIPSGTKILSHGYSPTSTKRRRGRKWNGNGFPHGAPVDHLPVIEASPISSSIGNFVPVVLTPTFSLPNGISPPSALEGSSFFNGFTPGRFNQILPYQHRQSLHFRSSGNLSTVPFQQLLDEVILRTQSPPELEEPLSAEPLNSIQPSRTDGGMLELKVIELCQESVVNGTQPHLQNGESPSFQNDGGSGGVEVGTNPRHQDGTTETKLGVEDAAHYADVSRHSNLLMHFSC